MNNSIQLIDNFILFNYYSIIDEELKFFKKGSIPMIYYPNGIPCFEANCYMLEQVKLSKSQKHRGGSLRTYANNIYHLVKFCFYNKKTIPSFSSLNDNLFKEFINSLIIEVDPKTNQRKRENNQVIKIGRECIKFLFFIQKIYKLQYFIGTDSFNAIYVFEKKSNYANLRTKHKNKTYDHLSFPYKSPLKRRFPISDSKIETLKECIGNHNDKALRIRNLCLIETLEQTGARRSEVLLLKVSDVKNALKSTDISPSLKIFNLKKLFDNTYRYIPVPRIFLLNLNSYIRKYRTSIIKKLNIEDHDYVFINHKNGKPLSPDTLTTYINSWKKNSGVTGDAMAHMFRHRFITEQLKCILNDYSNKNPEVLNELLTNTELLTLELLEWTGHSSIESVKPYVHLALSDFIRKHNISDLFTKKASIKLIIEKLKALSKESSQPDISNELNLIIELIKIYENLND